MRRALEWSLLELADERLYGLEVEEVLPHPNVSRMLVVLRQGGAADEPADPDELRRALHGVRGLLRTRVAGEIHRKRTPHLVFTVLCRETRAADEADT